MGTTEALCKEIQEMRREAQRLRTLAGRAPEVLPLVVQLEQAIGDLEKACGLRPKE